MTKLYLSGVETNKGCIDEKAIRNSKYILSSYFYLRKRIKDPFIAKLIQEYNAKGRLLIDSGTFSYLNGKKATEQQLDDYCKEYGEFIVKWGINQFVELDVDAIVGYPKVLEYRKYLEQMRGKQSIPIWHKSRGKSEFIKECDDYDYIGIGGIAVGRIKKSDWRHFKQLNDFAQSRGCKIHAMGFTPRRDLKEYGFYSCDSTSWARPVRFGGLDYFNGTRMVDRRFDRRFNPKKRKQILTMNWNEWCKYQHYVDN